MRLFVFPLLCAGFYAFYPPIVYWSKIGVVDPAAAFFLFVGVSTLLLREMRHPESCRLLALGASLASIASLTKYSAGFFLAPFLVGLLTLRVRREGLKQAAKRLILPFTVFFSIPVLMLVGYLLAQGAFEEYWMDTVWWQMSLASKPLEGKLGSLREFTSEFFVYSALFGLGAYAHLSRIRGGDARWLVSVSLLTALCLVYVYQDPQPQLLLTFLPLGVFVAWDGLQDLFFSRLDEGRSETWNTRLAKSFALVIALGLLVTTSLLPPYFHLDAQAVRVSDWPRDIDLDAQREVAGLISCSTSPGDEIFTTVAEFAFLSHRRITVPDIRGFKNQGFYIDMIGLDHNQSFEGPPPEMISPEDLIQAFRENKPKLLLKATGLYACADDYLWSGYFVNGTFHGGLLPYVLQNYALLEVVKSKRVTVEIYSLAKPHHIPLVLEFKNLTGLETVKILVREGACTAEVSLSPSGLLGERSLNMTYAFTDTKVAPPIFARMDILTGGSLNLEEARLIALGVYGDGGGNMLWVTVVSERGSSGIPVGPINWKGWKTVSVDPREVVAPQDVDLKNVTRIGVSVDYLRSEKGSLGLGFIIVQKPFR
ncbi:MAG: hypothetical protein QW057_07095 [Candidatus Bathyarchaeia archaeon]